MRYIFSFKKIIVEEYLYHFNYQRIFSSQKYNLRNIFSFKKIIVEEYLHQPTIIFITTTPNPNQLLIWESLTRPDIQIHSRQTLRLTWDLFHALVWLLFSTVSLQIQEILWEHETWKWDLTGRIWGTDCIFSCSALTWYYKYNINK